MCVCVYVYMCVYVCISIYIYVCVCCHRFPSMPHSMVSLMSPTSLTVDFFRCLILIHFQTKFHCLLILAAYLSHHWRWLIAATTVDTHINRHVFSVLFAKWPKFYLSSQAAPMLCDVLCISRNCSSSQNGRQQPIVYSSKCSCAEFLKRWDWR